MTKDIVKYTDMPDDMTWQNIIDNLTSVLTETDTPDKIVEATELILSGWPLYKVAKHLNVSTVTVRNWLAKYPVITQAIAHARKDLTAWRMKAMEAQYLLALKKSEEILTLPASYEDDKDFPVNVKLLGIQAQHARYVLSLFLGNKLDINITVADETPLLKAQADALNYIIDQARRQDEDEEIIEGTVRIIDEASPVGPLLDENGDPHYGSLGIFEENIDDEIMCHVCGKFFSRLDIHIRTKESLSNEQYEIIFGFAPGALKDKVDKVETPEEGDDDGSSEA